MAKCWWAVFCNRLSDTCRDKVCGSLFNTSCTKCTPMFEDFAEEDFKVGQNAVNDTETEKQSDKFGQTNEHGNCFMTCSPTCFPCCDNFKSCLPRNVFKRRKLSIHDYSVSYKHFSDYNDAALFPHTGGDTFSLSEEASRKVSINICSHSKAGSELDITESRHVSPYSINTFADIHKAQSIESIPTEKDRELDTEVSEKDVNHPDLLQFYSMKDSLQTKSHELSMTSSFAGDSAGSCQWSDGSSDDSLNSLKSNGLSNFSGSVNEQLDSIGTCINSQSQNDGNNDRKLIKAASMRSEEFAYFMEDTSENDSSDDQNNGKQKTATGNTKNSSKRLKKKRKKGKAYNFTVSYTDICDNGIQIMVTDYDFNRIKTDSFSESEYVMIGQKPKAAAKTKSYPCQSSSEHGSVSFGLTSEDELEYERLKEKNARKESSSSENVFIKPKYTQTSV